VNLAVIIGTMTVGLSPLALRCPISTEHLPTHTGPAPKVPGAMWVRPSGLPPPTSSFTLRFDARSDIAPDVSLSPHRVSEGAFRNRSNSVDSAPVLRIDEVPPVPSARVLLPPPLCVLCGLQDSSGQERPGFPSGPMAPEVFPELQSDVSRRSSS
jgi:hypothetical protein